MVVQFAAVAHPAPNALFEVMANAMERHLHQSTIGGAAVGGRCLGNVNAVFRSIGGSPRFLSPGYPNPRAVAAAMRPKASKTTPPRGAIVLWDFGPSEAGHIAVADGKGNSVNNWDSSTIVRTDLAKQKNGLVGWISPAQLGSGTDNKAKTGNPDYQEGAGDDGYKWPLPAPQDRPATSGISLPFFGSGDLSLVGGGLSTSVAQLIDSAVLDAGTESVAQLTLISHDPGLAIARSPLADIGAGLVWAFNGISTVWDISAVDVAAADGTVQIAARSQLAKRLRRTVTVRTSRKVSPSEWVTRTVVGAGGMARVEKSARRGEISQGDDQTEWDMLGSLASDLGWSWMEYAGVVVFGSRHWAWSGGPGRAHWQATWGADTATDVMDANLSQTADDPDNVAVGSITVPWNRGVGVHPWDTVELSGLGRWDGVWLVEQMAAATDGVSAVELQLSQPRQPSTNGTKSTKSGTRNGTPPKDKTTIAYAKWFARTLMATSRYNWGSDDQWDALEKLWQRESGWDYTAKNDSSGAYGIPQALPGNKMASAGKDWKTNPETQITWGLGYIKGRYGGPKRAWAHSEQTGWY